MQLFLCLDKLKYGLFNIKEENKNNYFLFTSQIIKKKCLFKTRKKKENLLEIL